MTTDRPAAPARTYEIDGIRGWAAFVVVLFHVYCEMLGRVLPGLRNEWLMALLNDRLAIVAFFVLSGDSLASAYFHRGAGAPLAWQVLRRYVRLTVPVLLSSAVVFALLKLGWTRHREVASMMQAEFWLSALLNFEPSLLHFLRYCLWDVYLTTSAERAYNPFLWTMQVELLGSLFIYLIALAWPRVARPHLWLMAIAAVLSIVQPLMAAFAIGFLFSYWRSEGLLARWRASESWQRWSLLALPAAFSISFIRPGVHTGLLVAVLLLACFHTNRATHRFFDNGVSRWLGKVSFPMYLLQFPVLISLMAPLLLLMAPGGREAPAFGALMWIALLTVGACVLAAAVFQPIESAVRQRVERVVKTVHDGVVHWLSPQRAVAVPQRASQFD